MPHLASSPHLLNYRRPWALVLVAGLIYLGAILAANGGDARAWVTIGDCFAACNGPARGVCEDEAEGYDGQFAYYIARDPLHAADCLDVPAYRYQRILLPLLGRALSLGQSALIPWAFAAVDLAALVIATALLEDLLRAERASRWFALSYGLFAGVFMAVRLSTSEALAYGLVIGALWAHQRGRLWLAAILLALAGLAKETTGLFAAGFLLYFVLHRRWRDAIRLALVAGTPFVLWQVALYAWLGELGLGSGGAKATPFELVPYLGLARLWTDGSAAAFLVLGVLLAIPIAALPSAWALVRAGRDLRAGRWGVYPCLLAANAAIFPFVPFSTYREPLGLLRFMPGLVLTVVLYAAHERLRRPLLYSTLWIVLLVFAVAG